MLLMAIESLVDAKVSNAIEYNNRRSSEDSWCGGSSDSQETAAKKRILELLTDE